jgi:hypothetical protein
MARTLPGAILEMLRRELSSRFHRDLVLSLEIGPATSNDLTTMHEELRREFPNVTWFAGGGDENGNWKLSVCLRPSGSAESLKQELARWASRHEPVVRKYTVRQLSLWRTARR